MKKNRHKPASLYRKYQKEVKEASTEVKKQDSSSIKKAGTLYIPRTIGICSLKKGSGCSHFAFALGNYLAEKRKQVYVVTKDTVSFAKAAMDYGTGIIEYEEYDHIIYDGGMLEELSKQEYLELRRCEKKVMVCLNNEIYLERLADFIRNEVHMPKSWTFLFNFVAEKDIQEVDDLMEEYSSACIPILAKEDHRAVGILLGKVWQL